MSIFSRISDIISANLNDIVEGMENPEKMLRQAVREMESTIEQTQDCTAKAIASKKVLQKELDKNRAQVKQWSAHAQTAVADSNDEMARKAISRKQEHEKLVVALQDEVAQTDIAIERLRHQLNAMQAKLAEAKRRLISLTARMRVAELRTKTARNPESNAQKSDVFAKFDRMREKVELAEAQAEAMRELTSESQVGVNQTLESDVQSANPEVEAELMQMKQHVKS